MKERAKNAIKLKFLLHKISKQIFMIKSFNFPIIKSFFNEIFLSLIASSSFIISDVLKQALQLASKRRKLKIIKRANKKEEIAKQSSKECCKHPMEHQRIVLQRKSSLSFPLASPSMFRAHHSALSSFETMMMMMAMAHKGEGKKGINGKGHQMRRGWR